MINTNKRKSLTIFLLGVFVYRTALGDINSATITEDTLQAVPNCLHYQIRGVCYWLGIGGVNTTDYIEQYLPDVVVSVFNKPGDDPWFEINHTLDQAGTLAEQKLVSSFTHFNPGSGQHSFSDVHTQNVFFKESNVIGNPALTLLSGHGFLPSTAAPLQPYYQSMLDSVAWRGLPQIKTTLAEEAYALVANLSHHVGTLLINWGGIYPHEGKIATSNDAKAAAVIAQRSGDLVTSSNIIVQGHLYQKLSILCGEECTASPIQENSPHTQFQMIYPVAENTCDYFGKTIDYGQDKETQTNGAYIWVIWRFYSGCEQGAGQFIGKTIIPGGQ